MFVLKKSVFIYTFWLCNTSQTIILITEFVHYLPTKSPQYRQSNYRKHYVRPIHWAILLLSHSILTMFVAIIFTIRRQPVRHKLSIGNVFTGSRLPSRFVFIDQLAEHAELSGTSDANLNRFSEQILFHRQQHLFVELVVADIVIAVVWDFRDQNSLHFVYFVSIGLIRIK